MTGGSFDDDNLQVYGGAKLLENEANGPRKRNARQHDTELIGNGIQTDSDTDDRLRGSGDMADDSSEEGLVAPKKKIKKEKKPMCYGIRRWCGCIVSRERRRISL